jgi:hypothetical protein
MPIVQKAREDPSFNLAALSDLIKQASHDTFSWLSPLEADRHTSISLMTFSKEVRPKRTNTEKQDESDLGNVAPLTEAGYHKVAKLKSDKQMASFVRRFMDVHSLRVVDEGSLEGLIPYYSGRKAIQSLSALVEDFNRAQKKKPHPWLVKQPAGKNKKEESLDESSRHKGQERGSFVQTESHHRSSSTSSWIHYVAVVAQEQTVYLLGARITAVVCIGSLLFGLYLMDESTHRARREKLGEDL